MGYEGIDTNAVPARVDSVSAYGTAAAPGAGAALATIAAGSLAVAGVYLVAVQVSLTGTIAAGDLDNFAIRKGSTPVKQIVIPPAANQLAFVEIQVYLDGATALSVNTVGAATASSVYSASITATRKR